MAYPALNYDSYLRLAIEKNLRFMHSPDELPPHRHAHALWQCRLTGELISRSYHRVLIDDKVYGSHGQKFIAEYIPKYRKLAEELGIELLYNPLTDIGPSTTRTPMKWRGKNGEVVVCTYHELAYGEIKSALRAALGLVADETVP